MALTLMAKFSIFEDDAAGVVTASIASVNAAQAAGEDFGAASAYASLGYSARMLRLDRVARRYFAQAQANAERASDLDDHAEARVNEAAAACGAGDWELGERAARDALVLARSARNPQQAASAQTVGFYVDYYRGRYAQAEGWSTPLRLAAQATGNAQHLGWALVMEATLDQERDALEAAVDKLQRAIGLFRESHDRVSETLAVGILAGVQARRGLWDLGLEHAAQARQRVRARFPVVFTLSRGFEGAADAALWRWQDLLRRGEPVPPHLRRDAFEGCSLYMRYAAIFRVGRPGAHRCLGWAHRLAGQPMRAQLHARCSVALAGKLSMPHTLQQAREELAALGDS